MRRSAAPSSLRATVWSCRSRTTSATISGAVANALFAGAPNTLAAAQEEFDSGNPHVAGFALATSVDLATKVVREKQTGRNVVAYLPADPGSRIPDAGRPWVIVGAH